MAGLKADKRGKLGSHLEWHGAKIRVVIRVPPTLREAVGKGKVKEALPTGNPREAEILKWPIIARLKAQLGNAGSGRKADILVERALGWRETMKAAQEGVGPNPPDLVEAAFDDTRDTLARTEQPDRLALFTAVALGHATPLGSLVDAWLKEQSYAPRVEEGHRHAVRSLTSWCSEAKVAASIETFTRKVAGQFVTDRFISKDASPATANKAVSSLRLYWKWLMARGHIEESANPWSGQSVVDKARQRRKLQSEPGDQDKRPFTNAEVTKLLAGLKADPMMADFCLVAALTGMRREEIATLRVRHVQAGVIKVPGTKTAAAARTVPVHSSLSGLISRRMDGKPADAFLFHELPEQQNPARGRGAPISQAFTRARRRLGVDDIVEGARQSRIDLHSFRRWFIFRARDALDGGVTGFTGWTLAEVVGHSKEDGPLGMTMGRYPGRSDVKALRACVEAVQLPTVAH